MSADLLAAFGTHKEVDHGSGRSGQEPEPILHQADDTWQPWPVRPHPSTAPQSGSIAEDNLWKTTSGGNDVLFDAEDFKADDLDDFGDFEQAGLDQNDDLKHTESTLANHATSLLLDLADDPSGRPAPDTLGTTHSPPGRELGIQHLAGFTNAGGIQSPAQESKLSHIDDEDEWGQFETTISASNSSATGSRNVPNSNTTQREPKRGKLLPNALESASKYSKTSLTSLQGSGQDDEFDAWDDFKDGPSTSEPVREPTTVQTRSRVATKQPTKPERPTNVPPPAALLSLMNKVVSLLASQARQTAKSEEVGSLAAQCYKVSARIISGRALRWKRDTILAQSMKIGAAGRSGGMKLTAIDKGESRKEDQEAEDLVAAWTRFSHVLNQAMVRAKIQKPPKSLSSKLSTTTATGVDVVNANHVCPVCGLRRNERINGIDVNVLDTFGEFWIETWGHTDCHDCWYGYNELLDQR